MPGTRCESESAEGARKEASVRERPRARRPTCLRGTRIQEARRTPRGCLAPRRRRRREGEREEEEAKEEEEEEVEVGLRRAAMARRLRSSPSRSPLVAASGEEGGSKEGTGRRPSFFLRTMIELGYRSFWAKVAAGRAQISRAIVKFL